MNTENLYNESFRKIDYNAARQLFEKGFTVLVSNYSYTSSDFYNNLYTCYNIVLNPEISDYDSFINTCKYYHNPKYYYVSNYDLLDYKKSHSHSPVVYDFFNKPIEIDSYIVEK